MQGRKGRGTVSSLHLLATALGVSITDFFNDEQEEPVGFVTPDARLRSQANGIIMESVGVGLQRQDFGLAVWDPESS